MNAVANYLRFETLDDAINAGPVTLIPCRFIHTDKNTMQRKIIQVGESENEHFGAGASSTQMPQTYVFDNGDTTIRIIDTPGIGDTRGIEYDKQNFSNILNYISGFDKLHGVCILLKPNESRLDIMFRYCINELLAQLHRSAASNIVFCFTNARSTLYSPGETMEPLAEHLSNLKRREGVTIPLNHSTVYCMDNEAFRLLCCLQNGVEFAEDIRKLFAESWLQAQKETQRMFEHIAELSPHDVKQTMTMNEARRMILLLAKPLADIGENIARNRVEIEAAIKVVDATKARGADFGKKLKVPHVYLKSSDLDYPVTVCTSGRCTETKPIANSTSHRVYFKTRCHERCYLSGIEPETYPNNGLQGCWALHDNIEKCRNCGCPWYVHQHIKFEQETVTEMKDDPHIAELIAENASEQSLKEAFIVEMTKRISQFENEQKEIDQIGVKFAAFLKKHAIVPINDMIEEYINHNIREKKEMSEAVRDEKLIKVLEAQLRTHQVEKRLLKKRMEQSPEEGISPTEVRELVKHLFTLPLNGKNIKELYEKAEKGHRTELLRSAHYANTGQQLAVAVPKPSSSNQQGKMDIAQAAWSESKKKFQSMRKYVWK